MPDPAMTEALREAYASAPVAAAAMDTIEVWHPAFTAPVRVAAGGLSFDGRLEAEAPRDAGDVVTFLAVPFRIVPPAMTGDGVPEMRIEIDNVERELAAQLDLAMTSPDPVELIYRRYLEPTAQDGPEEVRRGLHLLSVTAGLLRVTGTAGWMDLRNEMFPRLDYSIEQFPTLDFQ